MNRILFSVLIGTFLFSGHALADGKSKNCVLKWDEVYFKDLDGNMEYNFKTKKMEKQFQTYKYFQGNFPQKVSINIPYIGDCSKLEVNEVHSFRNIGPRAFVGGEEDHESHARTPKLNYEKEAFENLKPQVSLKKGVLTMTSFRIYDALSTLDFKKYHPWDIRYEVFFRGADGLDNKKVFKVDLKLTH